jgi:serine/threonine protein kinase
MSTVYKVLDRQRLLTDDPHPYLALKLLKPRFAASQEHQDLLGNEVSKARDLEHPNIVKIYDVHREDQAIFLLMEYLDGEPLARKIRDPGFRGWPAKRALPIIAKAAEALAFAHGCGVVHCDVKPASIFLTRNGEVKLFDFGLARYASSSESRQRAGDDASDTPGEAVTLAYSSPERIEGQPADPRDDVFSLACTAYELLTGNHPFDFASALEAREANVQVPWQRGLSFIQWRALRQGLALHRATRTGSVDRLMREMKIEGIVLDRLPLLAGVAGIASVLLGAAVVLSTGTEKPQAAASPLEKPRLSHSRPEPPRSDRTAKDELAGKARTRQPAVR